MNLDHTLLFRNLACKHNYYLVEVAALLKSAFSQMNERASLTKRSRLGSSRGIPAFAAVLLASSIWAGATDAETSSSGPPSNGNSVPIATDSRLSGDSSTTTRTSVIPTLSVK